MATPVPVVVLTGGPCGGKTTGLAHLSRELETAGWRVFTLPEMATLFYDNGIRPEEAVGTANGPFRLTLMRGQRHHEDVWREMAQLCPHAKKVLIQDRGLFDELPYTGGAAEFESHLGELGLSPQAAMRRYDLVVHLTSVAVDRPATYSVDTNPRRREDEAGAAQADAATWHAWARHPQLHRINNVDLQGAAIDIEEKLQSLVVLVKKCLEDQP